MKKIILLLSLVNATFCWSQDITGAYIHTGKTSGNTYSIGVVLYTNASLSLARPTITVSFGDNTSGTFTLSNAVTSGNLSIKTYTGSHTYPGFGQYLVNYLDSYRISGIKNIQNSSTQQIGVTAVINLSSLVSSNVDPTMLNQPVGLSVVNNTLVYNPSFSSPSGDSLSSTLENCVGAGYYLANGATVNATSGVFTFSNDTTGTYAFRYTVKVWRKNTQNSYIQIGSSQMDFLVNVTGVVGVREYASEKTLVAYPNPFTNSIKLNFDDATFRPNRIAIVNSIGQTLIEISQPANEIDLSILPTGIYYLKTSSGVSQQHVFKLVKQ